MTRPARMAAGITALVAAVALGAAAGAVTYSVLDDDPATVAQEVTVPSSEPAATERGLSPAQIYARTYRGVVEITASGTASAPLGGRGRSQGSGFVYDGDGAVVTNAHVVDGADSIRVRFADGKTYPAELVGTDASTDLAVLRVDAPRSVLAPLRLGNSADVQVGEDVVAIGSPFGLEGSLTSGVVSALHRQMRAPNRFTIQDSIQTDAAINHGNSGGPLLDDRAQVIGVNAQIESESGGNDGVGFAIPSNTVRSIVTQLLENGVVEHAYLGVEIQAVSEGVAITEVRSGTPAEEAGLEESTGTELVDGQLVPTGGDVIVAVDGDAVTTEVELQRAIDSRRPGDRVELTILRDGERRTVEVTLARRDS